MLNKKTKLRVLTGMGFTDYKEKGELIGQGTLGGAMVSACNLDADVNEYFHDSEEICYRSIRLQPLLFQDDVIHLTASGRYYANGGRDEIKATRGSSGQNLPPSYQ